MPPIGQRGVRRTLRLALAASLVSAAVAACGRDGVDRSGDAREGSAALTPADTESSRKATSLDALGAARSFEIRTALLAVNKALLNFHIVNGRYPADKAELESAPELASAVADLEALSRGLEYRLEGRSYALEVRLRDGSMLKLDGTEPEQKRPAPASPGS